MHTIGNIYLDLQSLLLKAFCLPSGIKVCIKTKCFIGQYKIPKENKLKLNGCTSLLQMFYLSNLIVINWLY